MRDFSWNVFAATGDIEAYLLYKECDGTDCEEPEDDVIREEEVNVN